MRKLFVLAVATLMIAPAFAATTQTHDVTINATVDTYVSYTGGDSIDFGAVLPVYGTDKTAWQVTPMTVSHNVSVSCSSAITISGDWVTKTPLLGTTAAAATQPVVLSTLGTQNLYVGATLQPDLTTGPGALANAKVTVTLTY